GPPGGLAALRLRAGRHRHADPRHLRRLRLDAAAAARRGRARGQHRAGCVQRAAASGLRDAQVARKADYLSRPCPGSPGAGVFYFPESGPLIPIIFIIIILHNMDLTSIVLAMVNCRTSASATTP